MRKIRCLLCLAAACVAVPLAAQTGMTNSGPEPDSPDPTPFPKERIALSAGPVVGINRSNFLLADIPESQAVSSMRTGVTTGGFLDMGISRRFSIRGELLFHYKTSRLSRSDETGSFRGWSMELPVFAVGHWRIGQNNRMLFGAGPYTDFGLSAVLKTAQGRFNLYEKHAENGDLPILETSNTGFALLVGWEFRRFEILATYKISMTDLLNAYADQISAYPQAWSIGLACRFGKSK